MERLSRTHREATQPLLVLRICIVPLLIHLAGSELVRTPHFAPIANDELGALGEVWHKVESGDHLLDEVRGWVRHNRRGRHHHS